MKNILTFTLLATALVTTGFAQENTAPDSLEIQIEQAIQSALNDSSIQQLPSEIATLTGSLLDLINAALKEAAAEIELEVERLDAVGGEFEWVTGGDHPEVERVEDVVIIREGDLADTINTFFFEDEERFNDLIGEDEERTPGSEGHWNGFSVGTVLLTDQAMLPGFEGAVLEDDLFLAGNVFNSWHMGVAVGEYRQRIFTDQIGITTGLGLDWMRLKVNAEQIHGNTALMPDVANAPLDTAGNWAVDTQKSHVQAGYLRVPLLLSLRTASSAEDGLHLEAGIVGGVRLFSSYVHKYSDDANRYKDRISGFGLSPLQFNGRITVGYENISVFSEFALNQLFGGVNADPVSSVVAPVVYPWTIGLVFHSFD